MRIIKHKFNPNKLKDTIVERKGLGHPDTIADGVAEAISIEYSKYCLDKFGAVLHHNLDKTLIRGGLFEVGFGSGKAIEPITLSINGRCSRFFGNQSIPFEKIAQKAAFDYLFKILPNFKKEYLKIENNANCYSHSKYWFNPKSLIHLPDWSGPHSNDTSIAVGYWPLVKAEEITLRLEESLYHKTGRPKFKNMGQDIKTIVYPIYKGYQIIMCIPLIGILTKSSDHYHRTISKIRKHLSKFLIDQLKIKRFELEINTADNNIKHEKFYLLHTGSCLEGGEEGAVGRGNNILGIISSDRPHSVEAFAGKNPQYHVGKVYPFFAQKMAYQLAVKYDCYCNVKMVSKNGNSLFNPSSIMISLSKEVPQRGIEKIIKSVLRKEIYRKQILAGTMMPVLGGEHLDKLNQAVFSRQRQKIGASC